MAAWGNRPDRFDMYSAGLVLVQMSIPKLRTPSSLKKFSESELLATPLLTKWLAAEGKGKREGWREQRRTRAEDSSGGQRR